METNVKEKVVEEIEKKEYSKKNPSFYVCCFLVYCIIGWIYEVIWEFAVGNGFVNRGFLHGPYLPIYGFGVLILLLVLHKLIAKKIKIGKINITPILVFLSILFIVSFIEYFASVLMELLFHKRWWDYSYDKLNLNGRISLRNSSLLAIGGFVLVYCIQPILNKVFEKLSVKTIKISSIIILSIVGLDFIITILGYIIK